MWLQVGAAWLGSGVSAWGASLNPSALLTSSRCPPSSPELGPAGPCLELAPFAGTGGVPFSLCPWAGRAGSPRDRAGPGISALTAFMIGFRYESMRRHPQGWSLSLTQTALLLQEAQAAPPLPQGLTHKAGPRERGPSSGGLHQSAVNSISKALGTAQQTLRTCLACHCCSVNTSSARHPRRHRERCLFLPFAPRPLSCSLKRATLDGSSPRYVIF